MRWAMRIGYLWLWCAVATFSTLCVIILRVASGWQMAFVVASVKAIVSHFGVLSDLCNVT